MRASRTPPPRVSVAVAVKGEGVEGNSGGEGVRPFSVEDESVMGECPAVSRLARGRGSRSDSHGPHQLGLTESVNKFGSRELTKPLTLTPGRDRIQPDLTPESHSLCTYTVLSRTTYLYSQLLWPRLIQPEMKFDVPASLPTTYIVAQEPLWAFHQPFDPKHRCLR